MNAITVQVTYRKGRPLAAYIYLDRRSGEKAARTEKITQDLLVDYGPDGGPVGIEIVSPGAVHLDDILGVFDRLGLGRPTSEDLAPLQAA